MTVGKIPDPDVKDGVRFSELSAEAAFALVYALAVTDPSNWESKFMAMQREAEAQAVLQKKRVLSGQDKRRAIFIGLRQLAERGLVTLARNEEGSHSPVSVHTDRIVMDGSGLILANGV